MISNPALAKQTISKNPTKYFLSNNSLGLPERTQARVQIGTQGGVHQRTRAAVQAGA